MNDQREEKRIWEPSCSTRSRTGCRVGKTSSSRSLGNLGKLPSKLHFSKMGHSVVPPFLECYVFFAFHVMSFLANFLLLFWYLLLLNRGPPTPAWEKFAFMLNFLQKKRLKLKFKIQLHLCDHIDQLSPPHSCETFINPKNDLPIHGKLATNFFDWEDHLPFLGKFSQKTAVLIIPVHPPVAARHSW